MKNFSEIEDNINELIISKSFTQLNNDERARALAYTGSEEEYTAMRNTLQAITGSFITEEDDIADEDMKNGLMLLFSEKHGKQINDNSKIIPIYRKPSFQLAVAASVALLIFFALPVFKGNESTLSLAKNNESKNSSGTVAMSDAVAPSELKDKPVNTASENKKISDLKANNVEPKLEEESNLANKSEKTSEGLGFQKEDLKTGFEEKDNNSLSQKLLEKEKNVDVSVFEMPPSRDEISIDNTNQSDKDKKESNKKEKDGNRAKKTASKNSEMDDVADKIMSSIPATGVSTMNNANNVNAYMNQNKNEIIDLLFTTF